MNKAYLKPRGNNATLNGIPLHINITLIDRGEKLLTIYHYYDYCPLREQIFQDVNIFTSVNAVFEQDTQTHAANLTSQLASFSSKI